MKQYWLKEDKSPSNLLVNFSSKIVMKINTIGAYNQHNKVALSQWSEYLDGMKSYLSKSVIAWDNMDRYPRLRNGGRFIRDFDYNVGYTIINDNTTSQPFVYVFMANLKPQEFGLKIPPTLIENKENDTIDRIISESINKHLRGIVKEDRDARIRRIVRESIERYINKMIA